MDTSYCVLGFIFMDTAYRRRGIRRIGNCEYAFSYKDLTLVRRIPFPGYGVLYHPNKAVEAHIHGRNDGIDMCVRTHLHSSLTKGYANRVGFSLSHCDLSLFIYQHGFEVAYLLIYVDDIVLAASSMDLLQCIISSLHKEFDMTDLGALNYFFGISATHDSTGMFMSQKKDPISDHTLYHSLAGGLQYLTFTCPYISYAMQRLYLHMHDPREPYLDFGLQLYASGIGDNLVSWLAKRKHTIFRSSAEAEYAKTAWLRNLLRELHTPLLSATLVYRNNVSAIYMTANPVQHYQTKHIEIDIHFVYDMVARGQYSCSSCTISLLYQRTTVCVKPT
nr:ribonuclease H-like domain-containing protein [Tanacetum cinerariifolium]